MTYGKRLEAAMEHAGKSRAELSRELGCTPQTIGIVITWSGEKDRKLSTQYHEHAARYLRVNANWLATGEGEMLAPDRAEPSMLSNHPERLQAILGSVAGMFRMIPEDEWADALMDVAAVLQKTGHFR